MNEMVKTVLKISEVKNNPNNPRLIKDDKFKKLVTSIQEFPEMLDTREIVVNKDHIILGGNMRFKAAKEAGLKEVPVKIVDWDEDKQRQFIIKDNVSGGEWDWDMMANEWDADELAAWGLDLPADWAEETEVEEDEAPEVSDEPPVSKLGEVYQLGRHRVMCGDSTDGLNLTQLLDGSDIDLVFTDPPYGIDANKMTMGSGKKQFHRGDNDWDTSAPDVAYLLELAPKVCIWGGNYFTDVLPVTNDWLCWHKKNDNLSFSEFELAWTNYGKNCRHISHHWGGEEKQHVTMKPIEVCVWGIKQSGDTTNVLDVFLGSGSTLIACEQTDRTCFGLELDPKYVDVVRRRYHKFVTGSEEGWQDATPAI